MPDGIQRRRVVVTFLLEEDERAPWNPEDIRRWLRDAKRHGKNGADLLEPNDIVEDVEFPDGMHGDLTDDDIF